MKRWDADGNEYLDYMSGLGAGIFGYGHPELTAAIKDQVDTSVLPRRRPPPRPGN